MLLKMAYIQEGLEQYPEALYYLNLYYNQNPSKKVLAKMETLAEAQMHVATFPQSEDDLPMPSESQFSHRHF